MPHRHGGQRPVVIGFCPECGKSDIDSTFGAPRVEQFRSFKRAFVCLERTGSPARHRITGPIEVSKCCDRWGNDLAYEVADCLPIIGVHFLLG